MKEKEVPILNDSTINLKENYQKNEKDFSSHYYVIKKKTDFWKKLVYPDQRFTLLYQIHKQYNHIKTQKMIQVVSSLGYSYWRIEDDVNHLLKCCNSCLQTTSKKSRKREIVAVNVSETHQRWSIDLFFFNGSIMLNVVDHHSRICSGRGSLSNKSSKIEQKLLKKSVKN